MLRWITRAAALFAALALVVVVAAWLMIRASLPDLDGTATVAGIADAVLIERDAAGIPTITAQNRKDLAFATGYVHAQDRYFQMDLIRRRAAGELSALIGSATLESDRYHRFHRFRARAEAAVEALNADHRELLDAYSAGVNAGLDSLGSRPFEYWVLRDTPAPWRPEDSVLVVYAMYMTLNDSRASRDIRRSYAEAALPPAVYAWLYPDGTDLDAPIVGDPRQPGAIPGPEVFSLRDVAIDARTFPGEGAEPVIPGSNNWVVSGALTPNGQALVANDMHLGIDVPNIYYQAHLVVDGPDARDTMGVSLPGSPFIVAGSTGHMAWGYTNSYGDWSDAVLIVPGETPGTYRTPDGDREFTRYIERIEVKGQAPVDYEIRETIWGPVDDVFEYPGGDVAVSWIAHKPEAVNINIVELETARSVEEAVAIANTMGIPPQNFVTGDRDGNIGWTIAGSIPNKQGFDPLLPADWSGSAGWQGWLEPDAYPRVINPQSGRIWTANSRVVDGAMLDVIGDGGYDRGARGSQIRDALRAGTSFSPDDMLAIQIDDRALFLLRWQRLLVETLDDPRYADDEDLAEYLALCRDWTPAAVPDSVGYRLVRGFRLQVQSALWSAVMAPVQAAWGEDVNTWMSPQFEAPLWQLVSERPPHLLPAGYDDWDAFLVDQVRGSIAYYRENYATPLAERTWGERNTASIRHPLSLAVPLLSGWLDMPAEPLPGDSDLPRAQGPGFGASERFAVSPGDRDNGILHMPVGQSGHPLSAFYSKGHSDWVQGRASPFLPGAADYRLELVPAAD